MASSSLHMTNLPKGGVVRITCAFKLRNSIPVFEIDEAMQFVFVI